MILITCGCVIGEREHLTHHYAKNYTSKDYYDSDTLYDSLIKEMWELTDDDYNAEEARKHRNMCGLGLIIKQNSLKKSMVY